MPILAKLKEKIGYLNKELPEQANSLVKSDPIAQNYIGQIAALQEVEKLLVKEKAPITEEKAPNE